jgi:hypothetical protein
LELFQKQKYNSSSMNETYVEHKVMRKQQ